jgi:hypothetical protein
MKLQYLRLEQFPSALGIITPIFIAINSSNFQQLTGQTSRHVLIVIVGKI